MTRTVDRIGKRYTPVSATQKLSGNLYVAAAFEIHAKQRE
jgi:hypothetical protein